MKQSILIILVILLLTGCARKDNANVQNSNIVKLTGEGEKITPVLNNSDSYESDERGSVDIDNTDDKLQDFSVIIEKKLMELKRDDFQCDDSLLNTYKGVLTSEVSFNDENGYTKRKKVFLNEMRVEDIPLKYYTFSLIDMNTDQIPELVLEVSVGGAGFILVFHLQDGEIYCHWYSDRQMKLIKADGTRRGSGSAYTFYISREEFDKSSNTTIHLASCEAGSDENNHAILEYFINEKEVSEEKFDTFMELFDHKEDAVWCEFPSGLTDRNMK